MTDAAPDLITQHPFTDDETGHCHINVNGRPCGKSKGEHQTFYEK